MSWHASSCSACIASRSSTVFLQSAQAPWCCGPWVRRVSTRAVELCCRRALSADQELTALCTRCATSTVRQEVEQPLELLGLTFWRASSNHSRYLTRGMASSESKSWTRRHASWTRPSGTCKRQAMQASMDCWKRGGGAKAGCAARARMGCSSNNCVHVLSSQSVAPTQPRFSVQSLRMDVKTFSATPHCAATSSACSKLAELSSNPRVGTIRCKSSPKASWKVSAKVPSVSFNQNRPSISSGWLAAWISSPMRKVLAMGASKDASVHTTIRFLVTQRHRAVPSGSSSPSPAGRRWEPSLEGTSGVALGPEAAPAASTTLQLQGVASGATGGVQGVALEPEDMLRWLSEVAPRTFWTRQALTVAATLALALPAETSLSSRASPEPAAGTFPAGGSVSAVAMSTGRQGGAALSPLLAAASA
mmetsp:Transcript_20040/g.45189  ORF Transcript_20040/g.45189 Transcript_20040/m.45189 type:complete len:420 (+) Transcript_20040:1467-2726(+)